MAVDAVVYYRVSNATISVTNVEDAHRSTRLLAQTTLRNVLGTKNLSEILSDRENISHFMQVCYRSAASWVLISWRVAGTCNFQTKVTTSNKYKESLQKVCVEVDSFLLQNTSK